MHLGNKSHKLKALGNKSSIGSTLGYKHDPTFDNITNNTGNPGIGLTTDKIIAPGHYQFQPVGLINPNKHSNKIKSKVEKY